MHKKINCELNYDEWALLVDILGHVNYDEEEAKIMSSLRKKLEG